MAKSNQVPPEDQGPQAPENRQAPPTSRIPETKYPLPAGLTNSEVPLTASLTNYGDRLARFRGMLGPCMKAVEPAQISLSNVTTSYIAESAHKNHLGTDTPSKMAVGIDDSKRYLYMVPVHQDTPGATEFTYRDGQVHGNLYETFFTNDRLVKPGVREYYDVKLTPGVVTIEGNGIVVKGWGIYVDLHDVTRESVNRLSDEERASRAAKAAQTRAAKKANKQKQKESQTPTPESEDDTD
jgi:hypothetical protein